MKRNGRMTIGIMVTAGSLLLAALPAAAQLIISDSFTVYDANHGVYASVSIDEGSESASQLYFLSGFETTAHVFSVPGVVFADLADPTKFGNATTLIESDGSYSDIFGVVGIPIGAPSGYFLAFNSDSEAAPAAFGAEGTISLQEGNGIFDATAYLNPSLQGLGYTAEFVSDTVEPVPEPGTLVLLGSGLVGLLGYGRRRMKK